MKYYSNLGPYEIGPGFYKLLKDIAYANGGKNVSIACDDGRKFDWYKYNHRTPKEDNNGEREQENKNT